MTGVVSDLSGCDISTAKQMVELDNNCAEFGVGSFYGQLTILGYKVEDSI